MKKIFLIGFLIFIIRDSAFGQKYELMEFRFSHGLCTYNTRLYNLKTLKSSFPESEVMSLLPEGSTELNYFQLISSPVVNFSVGISRLNATKRSSVMQFQLVYSNYYGRYADFIISKRTPMGSDIDSVWNGTLGYGTESIMLGFAIGKKWFTEQKGKWSLGFGVDGRFLVHQTQRTYLNYREYYIFSKPGVTDDVYVNRTYIKDKSEYFDLRSGINISVFVPITLQYQLSKKPSILENFSLFYEIAAGTGLLKYQRFNAEWQMYLQNQVGIRIQPRFSKV